MMEIIKNLKIKSLEKNNRFHYLLERYKILNNEISKLRKMQDEFKDVKEELSELIGDFKHVEVAGVQIVKHQRHRNGYYVESSDYEVLKIEEIL